MRASRGRRSVAICEISECEQRGREEGSAKGLNDQMRKFFRMLCRLSGWF
jgi:hypothetical protein